MAYFFYVDESGNRVLTQRAIGLGQHIYALVAIGLYDQKWHGFSKTIDQKKRQLIEAIRARTGRQLSLADCEVKANWLLNPVERENKSAFLHSLTDGERNALVDYFFQQLNFHRIPIFSVVVDKRQLKDYFDQQKLHRKAWELLIEQVEWFMAESHDRHQAIMIADDVSAQMNQSLALKHAYVQDQGTASGRFLRHICEMPMFVRSELSNGVQLADLCAYNIYRAFRDEDLDHKGMQRIRDRIWFSSGRTTWMGLKVFPDAGPLKRLEDDLKALRALDHQIQGPQRS